MSLEATIWAKGQLARVPKATAKTLLLVLADEVRGPEHGGDGRTCWPGRSTLVEITGLDRRTIARALAELRELRLIACYPRFRENGRGRRSDLIELYGPAFCCDPQGQPGATKGADLHDQGGEVADQGGNLPPEPSKNRLEEPTYRTDLDESPSTKGAKRPSSPHRLDPLDAIELP